MVSQHDDPAATISRQTARRLVAGATPSGRRLLELFARSQLLRLDQLRKEFGTSQNGLNALLGHLTREFQRLQGEPGFYIFLRKIKGWAIGDSSARNLRRALEETERERQRKLGF